METLKTEFSMQRRVEFAETDMAGIAHFTNFFKYMEETEHAFLRARGLSVVLNDAKGKLGFPKLEATCEYKRPVRYEDVVEVDAVICCEDGKTLRYEFAFSRQGTRIAFGRLRTAFCRFPLDQPPYAVPINSDVMEKLFSDHRLQDTRSV